MTAEKQGPRQHRAFDPLPRGHRATEEEACGSADAAYKVLDGVRRDLKAHGRLREYQAFVVIALASYLVRVCCGAAWFRLLVRSARSCFWSKLVVNWWFSGTVGAEVA